MSYCDSASNEQRKASASRRMLVDRPFGECCYAQPERARKRSVISIRSGPSFDWEAGEEVSISQLCREPLWLESRKI